MKDFDPDILKIDDLLTDDEKMVRDTIHQFVNKRVKPIIGKHYMEGTFPKHLIKEIADLGLLGANISGYGCAGMNNVAYGLCMQELERGDSGVRSFASVQSGLVMYPILAFGSDKQKETYLPRLAKAEIIGCFGLTEPDFGSNPAGMLTKCVKKGSKYILNGTKRWITNADIADIAIVWARNEKNEIEGFIVDKKSKGYEAREIKEKLSLRASDTGELILEDCEVPEENKLPFTQSLKSPLMCLTQARYGIAWGAMGAALDCFEEAVQYSKTRVQFDKPIGAFQMIQEKLVYMLEEIVKGQLLALRVGRLKDENKYNHAMVSLAKKNNVFQALTIARIARDILGASGITIEYNCMRHMCNLESVITYEGTHNVHTLVLGNYITGIDAFK
ncbi:MAG: acyl-CoA dehydrogenase family protein [Planctomycetes bacterium]|nr:acyl-CoA dehydrogenase family protein [Planctomycetota bacterium]